MKASLSSLALSILLSGLFSATSAYAEYKLATIDVNKVLNDSKEAVTKRKEIENKSLELRKKLEERGRKLKDQEAKLKESKASEESKEFEKFKVEARDFDRDVKDAQEDLRGQFLKLNKTLADKALKIITDYAKANRFDLVLDKSDKGRSPILFGSGALDITDAVLAKMND